MLVCLFCLTGTGCGDFLKEFSRDLTYAESWEDLQELLIGSGYIRASTMDSPVIFEQHYPYLYVMDDDAAASNPVSDNINISSYYAYLYYAFIWQQVPYGRYRANNDKPWDDTVFKDFYEYIANLNVIEKWVDEFPNGTVVDDTDPDMGYWKDPEADFPLINYNYTQSNP